MSQRQFCYDAERKQSDATVKHPKHQEEYATSLQLAPAPQAHNDMKDALSLTGVSKKKKHLMKS